MLNDLDLLIVVVYKIGMQGHDAVGHGDLVRAAGVGGHGIGGIHGAAIRAGGVTQGIDGAAGLQLHGLIQQGQRHTAGDRLRRPDHGQVSVVLIRLVQNVAGHGPAGVQPVGLGEAIVIQEDVDPGELQLHIYIFLLHGTVRVPYGHLDDVICRGFHNVPVGNKDIGLLTGYADTEGGAGVNGSLAGAGPQVFAVQVVVLIAFVEGQHPDHAVAGLAGGEGFLPRAARKHNGQQQHRQDKG